MKLQIEIFSYWHTGSGHGSAGDIDAAVLRDTEGLPFLPGRSVKGLLRDACALLDLCNPATGEGCDVSSLFGKEDDRGRIEANGHDFGCSSAHLPEDQREWLLVNKNCAPYLFETISGTALEDDGTAKDKSLRKTEVTLPLVLHCELSGLEPSQEKRIEQALPLIRGLGKARNRGLGRCQITIIENKEGAAQ